MITRITLKNVASYGENLVVLETDKTNKFYLSPTQKGVFSLKSENKDAKDLESQTDHLVCDLYGLTEGERNLVRGV